MGSEAATWEESGALGAALREDAAAAVEEALAESLAVGGQVAAAREAVAMAGASEVASGRAEEVGRAAAVRVAEVRAVAEKVAAAKGAGKAVAATAEAVAEGRSGSVHGRQLRATRLAERGVDATSETKTPREHPNALQEHAFDGKAIDYEYG